MEQQLFNELYECAINDWLRQIKNTLAEFNTKNQTQYTLPLILAIASRETNMRHIIGDNGHGFGLMQIDIGTITDIDHWWNVDFRKYIMEALTILNYKRLQIITRLGTETSVTINGNKYPYSVPVSIPIDQLYRINIAAYNAGMLALEGYVRHNKNPDFHTTGRNYSKDVISRAAIFDTLIRKCQTITKQLI